MELLGFRDEMFQYYKKNINGNENISLLEAEKKMTRNMKCAHVPDSTGYKGQMYQYGSLWFVVYNNRIVWMRNHCHVPKDWKLNKKEYLRLNKELGIKDDSTYISLTKKKFNHDIKKAKRMIKEKYHQLVAAQ